MIDNSEKRDHQLASELENSHDCEKRSKCSAFIDIEMNFSFSCR